MNRVWGLKVSCLFHIKKRCIELVEIAISLAPVAFQDVTIFYSEFRALFARCAFTDEDLQNQ